MNQTELEQKITEVIETKINPSLSAHMGGALLSACEDGTAYIKFTGSCRGCYAADDTMDNVVRRPTSAPSFRSTWRGCIPMTWG